MQKKFEDAVISLGEESLHGTKKPPTDGRLKMMKNLM